MEVVCIEIPFTMERISSLLRIEHGTVRLVGQCLSNSISVV